MTRKRNPVAAELERLGGASTAVALCDALVAKGMERRASQLAIQRAFDDKTVIVKRDWTLCLPNE